MQRLTISKKIKLIRILKYIFVSPMQKITISNVLKWIDILKKKICSSMQKVTILIFLKWTDILKYIYICFINGKVDHRLKYGSDEPSRDLWGEMLACSFM